MGGAQGVLTRAYGPGLTDGGRVVAYATAIFLAAAGVLHVSAAADHTNLPVMLAGFIVVATLQVAFAGLLLWRRPGPFAIVAALALTAGAVGTWLISRTMGLPLLPGGHMEPIGFKDSVTVLFELASVPGLLLLASRELATVRLPSPRLGTQTLAGLGAAAFALFVPALVLGGGGHHSAGQLAAMGGHSHGGEAAGRSHDGEDSHGLTGEQLAAADEGDDTHAAGGREGHGAPTGRTEDGHSQAHASSSGDTASLPAGLDLSGTGGGGGHDHATGGHGGGSDDHSGGSDDHSGGGADHGAGGGRLHSKGGHDPAGREREHANGEDHGKGETGHGEGEAGPGEGGHGHGGEETPEEAPDNGIPGPEDPGSMSWANHRLDYEPARPGKDGEVGSGYAFVYRGPADPSSGTVGHHSQEPCEPTPEQQAAADQVVAETWPAVRKYDNDFGQAIADGFTYVFPLTDRIFHMVNVRRVQDSTVLDPDQIESFLYVMTDDGLTAIAGMYVMPKFGMPGPQVGGCLTRWHEHAGLAGRLTTGGTQDRTPEMLHVWTYKGLNPWSHYDGRSLSQLWTPGSPVPSVCRNTGDASDACLP